ncbi:MAG: type II toxin-antitoxin system RelE/ParE family toxin [Candidatus Staskawiczbacteria bacterium]|nr:type II toxin-antitoxin system RelE/ParE family toxin [Candidatus Staskawiczbacteria bacterium]
MEISRIYYHPQFRKSFFDLSKEIQKVAKIKIILFKNNPFTPSLKTHKLFGKLKKHWSFTVKGQYRIIFVFNDNNVIFLDIGPHDIYK